MSRHKRTEVAREATRRAILDAALALFVADGYAQVSIRSIAARVEYSPGAIYSYFPSKDDIFFALAEEGFRLLGARHLTTIASDDPLHDLRATAWQFYEFSVEHPEYFALVFLDRRVPRIGREYERFAFMLEFKGRLLAKVQRCIDEGIFSPMLRADMALRLVWAPIFGLATLRLSQRLAPEEDPNALVRLAIDITITGLRAGSSSNADAAYAVSAPTDLSATETV